MSRWFSLVGLVSLSLALLVITPGSSARQVHNEPMSIVYLPLIPNQLNRVYLSIITQPTGPAAAIRFSDTLSDGVLISPTNVLRNGATILYYEVRVAAPESSALLSEVWEYNGVPQPALARSLRLIAGEEALYLSGIARSTGAPLASGHYRLTLFFDDPIKGRLILAYANVWIL